MYSKFVLLFVANCSAGWGARAEQPPAQAVGAAEGRAMGAHAAGPRQGRRRPRGRPRQRPGRRRRVLLGKAGAWGIGPGDGGRRRLPRTLPLLRQRQGQVLPPRHRPLQTVPLQGEWPQSHFVFATLQQTPLAAKNPNPQGPANQFQRTSSFCCSKSTFRGM